MKDKEKQFKERIDCGVAYCEDIPINQKQIKELANIIQNACSKCKECEIYNTDMLKYFKGVDCVNLKKALNAYNAGYRKIDKDKEVVLTEKEYEIAMIHQYDVGFGFGYKKGSKETAEKIYRELQEHGTTYVKKWIEKQFTIEIKE